MSWPPPDCVSIYRVSSLSGLPDVGDPFDVEAFRRNDFPESEDAFRLYDQALSRFQPAHIAGVGANDRVNDWRSAGPEVRAWAEANREAMAVWRRATDRPRMPYSRPDGPQAMHYRRFLVDNLGLMVQLASLEGSRLEERGDLAEAWGWYRASLRCIHHFDQRGDFLGPVSRARSASRRPSP